MTFTEDRMANVKSFIIEDVVRVTEQFELISVEDKAKYHVELDDNFVFIFDGDFYFAAVTNHPKAFYVSSNHADPENPITAKEAAEKLMELMEYAEPLKDNPDILEIKNDEIETKVYWGKYVDSLQEAIAWAVDCKSKPVAQWDKEYNIPVDMPKAPHVPETKESIKAKMNNNEYSIPEAMMRLMVEHNMREIAAQEYLGLENDDG